MGSKRIAVIHFSMMEMASGVLSVTKQGLVPAVMMKDTESSNVANVSKNPQSTMVLQFQILYLKPLPTLITIRVCNCSKNRTVLSELSL